MKSYFYKFFPTLRRSFIYPSLLFAALLTAGIATAAWSGPPAGTPPNNCTTGYAGCDAPVNLGGGMQIKTGGLTVGSGAVGTGLIVANGNVGIGTTTPFEKLDVLGGVSVHGDTWANTGSALMTSSGALGPYLVGNTDSSGNSTINSYAMRLLIGGLGFKVAYSPVTAYGAARTFTDAFIVTTTGNVGIGTTNPGIYGPYIVPAQLTVSGGNNSGFGVFVGSGNIGIPTGGIAVQGTNDGSGGGYTAFSRIDVGNFRTNYVTLDYTTNNNVGFLTTGQSLAFQTGNASRASGYDSSKTRMVIDTSGNVGIGTVSPAVKFHVVGPNLGVAARFTDNTNGTLDISFPVFNVTNILGNSTDLSFSNQSGEVMRLKGANVGIGTASPGQKLDVAGTVQAYAFVYNSDERLKENISPIADGLSKVLALQGVTFNWKDPSKGQGEQIGFIAQEVEKVVPELVQTNPSTTLKSVDYAKMTALLVEAVKSQQQEIDDLKAQVAALKAAK